MHAAEKKIFNFLIPCLYLLKDGIMALSHIVEAGDQTQDFMYARQASSDCLQLGPEVNSE